MSSLVRFQTGDFRAAKDEKWTFGHAAVEAAMFHTNTTGYLADTIVFSAPLRSSYLVDVSADYYRLDVAKAMSDDPITSSLLDLERYACWTTR